MWLIYNYIVDWEEFIFISKYLNNNSIAFDIGANMGFYTLWMSKYLSKGGEIHSFEPDKNNYYRLSQNISINTIESKIVLNQLGVYRSTDRLYISTGLDGENHIVDDTYEGLKTVIDAISIDDYVSINHIPKIDFIKIDVEGFELEVLKGATMLLSQKYIQVIQLELNKALKNSNITVDDITSFIDSIGYTICHYDVENNILFPTKISDERENYFILHDLDGVNKFISISKSEKI
jgi:FkbM family methyltransferase